MELTHHEKKQIAIRIEQLKNKKHYRKIFELVNENNNKYTVNDNGVYLNINTLSTPTLLRIKKFLDDIDSQKVIIPVPNEYVPYSESDSSVSMSTQERHFMKRLREDKNELNAWGTTEANTSESCVKPKIDVTPLFTD
jgi:hypothetical protein